MFKANLRQLHNTVAPTNNMQNLMCAASD